MKRHTRPYGCTACECDKRFGSRSDWKRHEETVHPNHGHGNGVFWCGFCSDHVLMWDSGQRGEARLRHIGDHFDKEKADIDQWIYAAPAGDDAASMATAAL